MSIFSTLEKDYEVMDKIHESGLESIYKVRHRLLDELRAVRIILPDQDTDPDLLARFKSEARSTLLLQHSNLVELYDFSITPAGQALIVMEFVDGVSLRSFDGGQGLLPISSVLEIATQTLGAIDFLHNAGLIHRNLSPEGILLTQDRQGHPLVKITDLGLVKSLQDGQQVNKLEMFLGKTRYASPEQFGGDAGESEVVLQSDLYSFGIVLYELLTGALPITGDDLVSFASGHLFDDPRSFDETDREGRVPLELRQLVLSSLAKDPDDRPPSAHHFSECLRAFQVEDESLAAGKTTQILPNISSSVAIAEAPTMKVPQIDVEPGAERITRKLDTSPLTTVDNSYPDSRKTVVLPQSTVVETHTVPLPVPPAEPPLAVPAPKVEASAPTDPGRQTPEPPSSKSRGLIAVAALIALVVAIAIFIFRPQQDAPLQVADQAGAPALVEGSTEPHHDPPADEEGPETRLSPGPGDGSTAATDRELRDAPAPRPALASPQSPESSSGRAAAAQLPQQQPKAESNPPPPQAGTRTSPPQQPQQQQPQQQQQQQPEPPAGRRPMSPQQPAELDSSPRETKRINRLPGETRPTPPPERQVTRPQIPTPETPRAETVRDPETGLTWLTADNNRDIDWAGAKAFCENTTSNHLNSWRLPTLTELQSLFDPESQNTMKTRLGIKISDICVWTAQGKSANQAEYFVFMTGESGHEDKTTSSRQRALCVTGG